MTFTGTTHRPERSARRHDLHARRRTSAALASLSVDADDQGNTGSGGALSGSATMDITVGPVNDAPVVTVPGPSRSPRATWPSSPPRRPTWSASATSTRPAATSSSPWPATSGTVTLATTTGLTFSAGDGDHDATMTFTGTLTALNAALDGMTFTPDAGFVGSASLSVDANDQGNTGSGGSATDHQAVTIDVTAVVNPPAPRLRLSATSVAVSSSGHLVVPVVVRERGVRRHARAPVGRQCPGLGHHLGGRRRERRRGHRPHRRGPGAGVQPAVRTT